MKNKITLTINTDKGLSIDPPCYEVVSTTLHGSDGLIIEGDVIVKNESGNEFTLVAGTWHTKEDLERDMHKALRQRLIDVIIESDNTIMTHCVNGKCIGTHSSP